MTLHSELFAKDIKNLLDDGSGEVTFGDFCTVMDTAKQQLLMLNYASVPTISRYRR